MKYTASITETGNHEADSSVIFRPHHSDVTCSNARRAESRTLPQICSCILLDHGRRTRPEVRTGMVSLHGSFKGFPCFGIRRGISHVLPGQKLGGSCDNWKKKGKTKCNVSGCPCIICDVFGCSSLRSAAIYPLARGICINIYISNKSIQVSFSGVTSLFDFLCLQPCMTKEKIKRQVHTSRNFL